MIKAVIFDMDGVLIDSEPLWRESATIIFQQAGAPLTHALMRQTSGLRIDEFVQHWHRHFKMDAHEPTLRKIILQDVCDRIRTKGQALPFAKEAVQLVKDRGLKVGLATSSPTVVINAVLERIQLSPKAFDVRLSAEKLSHGKPHPEIYIQAAKKLGVAPTDCLAIEDSINGMVAAMAARMTTRVIPDTSQREDKRFGLADIMGESLGKLDDVIGNLS